MTASECSISDRALYAKICLSETIFANLAQEKRVWGKNKNVWGVYGVTEFFDVQRQICQTPLQPVKR